MSCHAGTIEAYTPDDGAKWLPDNKSFLYRASEAGHRPRTYLQGLDGGPPRAVLPDDVRAMLVSLDGRTAAGIAGAKAWGLYPLSGGAPSPLPGLTPTDDAVGWSSDGSAIIVASRTNRLTQLVRVDMRTGARRVMRDVKPAGPLDPRLVVRNVTADGEQFTYGTIIRRSVLYVVTGVQGAR